MSAWLCSQDHLNLITNASPHPNENTFKMLLEENLNSLRARYGDEIDADEGKFSASYRFEPIDPAALIERVYTERRSLAQHYPAVSQPVTPDRIAAQVRQSAKSYDYQSCEHDGWPQSEACRIVSKLVEDIPENEKLETQALWAF